MNGKGVPLHVFTEIEAELPRLREFALCLAPNTTAAEDLVQEAAARALAGYDRRPAEVAMSHWLMSLVHNLHLGREPERAAPTGGGVREEDEIGQRDHRLMRRALTRARMMLPRRPQAAALAALPS